MIDELISEYSALKANLSALTKAVSDRDLIIADLKARLTPAPVFNADFTKHFTNYGFFEQSKVPGRATMVNVFGRPSVRLHTEPGDTDVAGSGLNDRNDLTLSQQTSDGYEGKEHWWAHSILFPDDYINPPAPAPGGWNWGVVFDFHNTTLGAWQANFQIDTLPDNYGGLRLRGYGGINSGDGEFTAPIGIYRKNVWYDFVYHVKWSSGTDGFFDAWLRIGTETIGRRLLQHKGPTLYQGQGVYLKLANYHTPHGKASSVIHSRVLRGTTAGSVALTALEGV